MTSKGLYWNSERGWGPAEDASLLTQSGAMASVMSFPCQVRRMVRVKRVNGPAYPLRLVKRGDRLMVRSNPFYSLRAVVVREGDEQVTVRKWYGDRLSKPQPVSAFDVEGPC
jgi:hypothetical protein